MSRTYTTGVTSTERLVLLALASVANLNAECITSVTTIRDRAGLTDDEQTRKALDRLRRKGRIEDVPCLVKTHELHLRLA